MSVGAAAPGEQEDYMRYIYKHEIKQYWKTWLLWSVCVGGMGVACILLFSSLREEMEGMADSFADMGAFSAAFGMDRLSVATLKGFFAAEVGTIHELGGAMFAAVVSMNILSREEDGHTSEFLFSLPVSRGKVVLTKWGAVCTGLLLFQTLCAGFYGMGFVLLGEALPGKELLLYYIMQLLMGLELAGICFAASAFSRQNRLGAGLGLVLLFYALNLVGRVAPKMESLSALSPFSYANASEILGAGELAAGGILLGAGVLAVALWAAFVKYTRKDLL